MKPTIMWAVAERGRALTPYDLYTTREEAIEKVRYLLDRTDLEYVWFQVRVEPVEE